MATRSCGAGFFLGSLPVFLAGGFFGEFGMGGYFVLLAMLPAFWIVFSD